MTDSRHLLPNASARISTPDTTTGPQRRPLNRALMAGAAALIMVGAAGPAFALADDDKEKPKTIEKMVEDFDRIDGFFTLYRDPETGDLLMELTDAQLGQEFIAFSYVENGVLDAGFFKGAYGDQQILEPRRYFDKIEFVEKSTAFYFDPAKPISRASDANVSPAIVASLDIKAKTEDDTGTRYLVDASDLLLTEAIQQLKPSPNPDRPPNAFSPGDIAGSKTKYHEIRNYPQNTDIIVDYVFENKYPSNRGGDAVTDARSLTVQMQHSFIQMPDDGFEPRVDDYRIGYFFDKVTDLTSDEAANYRDLINRWRLVKKDPAAALSEPVTPITWWIENTTPTEYRDTIRDAVLAWNLAFEKAGFKNAIVVKTQPDDADWDAGDIRYNVLRWTSSPQPPFGGYGPSFSNPRTGELIGADIMLEYVFIKNRIQINEVFDLAAGQTSLSESHHGHDDDHALPFNGHSDKAIYCSAGHALHLNTLFGQAMLTAQGADEAEKDELIRQSLYYLLLHEVGHTLGLNHNMKASVQWGPREVHDASVTKGAPTGSVMDYPAINMAPLGVAQGDYYMQRPGPYDDWAIEFGYRPDFDEATRKGLLSRAGEPGLAFGNDADDMRAPGRGIDPRVNINDMSADPVAYAVDRIKLAKNKVSELVGRYDEKDSWQSLVQAYLLTTGQHAAMAQVISRQVGGVYVDRQYPDQQAGTAPYHPVPVEKQRAAIDALARYVYAADAFTPPADLAARLQPQRRGFNFSGQTEDPKIHERALAIQMGTIAHLLNPVVLDRMKNSALYGNGYTATDMVLDLNEAIIGDDLTKSPNSFRRALHIAYTQRLAGLLGDQSVSAHTNAVALAALMDIKSRFGLFDFNLSAATRAHRAHINRLLKAADV
ncbi:MAG: zinc-dependent metalloprotease [Pseudomonadota bacterium]